MSWVHCYLTIFAFKFGRRWRSFYKRNRKSRVPPTIAHNYCKRFLPKDVGLKKWANHMSRVWYTHGDAIWSSSFRGLIVNLSLVFWFSYSVGFVVVSKWVVTVKSKAQISLLLTLLDRSSSNTFLFKFVCFHCQIILYNFIDKTIGRNPYNRSPLVSPTIAMYPWYL